MDALYAERDGILMNKNISILIVFTLLMISCKTAENYMPLSEGDWWEYSVTEEEMGFQTEETFSLTEVTGVVESARHGTLYRVESKSEDERGNYSDATIRYESVADGKGTSYDRVDSRLGLVFLQGPIQEGARWSTMDNEVDNNERYRVSFRIESTDATVNVPAGRFDDCLHVVFEYSYDYSLILPGEEDDIVGERWYAPGVGVVKSRTTMENDNCDFTWERNRELIDFEIN